MGSWDLDERLLLYPPIEILFALGVFNDNWAVCLFYLASNHLERWLLCELAYSIIPSEAILTYSEVEQEHLLG